MKIEYIRKAINRVGWSFTDLLTELSTRQNDSEFRTFWLQYQRYTKRTAAGTAIRMPLDEGGVKKIAKVFRKELLDLGKSSAFGEFQLPVPGNLDNPETDGSLEFISNMVPAARERAPNLMRFFGLLSAPAHQRTEPDLVPKTAHLVWASMHLYHIGRKKFNNVPKLLGLYLLQSGVKKRTIDMLSSIGFCTSYTTSLECQKALAKVGQSKIPYKAQSPVIVFAHDNFDFSEQPSGERVGERKTFVSITNGIIINCPHLPMNGLKQRSWHPEKPLDSARILSGIYAEPETYWKVGTLYEINKHPSLTYR